MMDLDTEQLPHVLHNLSRREFTGLKWIQQQSDLAIIPANKNLGLCVLDKVDYEYMVKAELAKTPDAFSIYPHPEQYLHDRRHFFSFT